MDKLNNLLEMQIQLSRLGARLKKTSCAGWFCGIMSEAMNIRLELINILQGANEAEAFQAKIVEMQLDLIDNAVRDCLNIQRSHELDAAAGDRNE